MTAALLSSKLSRISGRLVARHLVPFQLDRSFVSITFDDFPRSALDNGGRILEADGLSGTFYAAFGLANAETPSGPVGGLSDLAACVERGHEIGCHTYDHLNCLTASTAEMDASLSHNLAVARDLGLPRLKHFAYPFGSYGIAAKKTAMRHYTSARSVSWGVNQGNIDLALLKSVPLYPRSEAPDLSRYFDALQARPGWLIIYTHDVSDEPSPFGCTPEKLKFAIRRAREIGATILPVGAVVDKLLLCTNVGR
jgi:peptidoglycan/xylan/chitin deacetylase (PgdA/CDA1 family)